MSSSQYHEFQIKTNLISNQNKINFKSEKNIFLDFNKSLFLFKEIPFNNGTDPISEWNKFNFTWEQIQFQILQIQFCIVRNPISHYNKSNLTFEQLQFKIVTNPISHVTNPISHWNKSKFKLDQIRLQM